MGSLKQQGLLALRGLRGALFMPLNIKNDNKNIQRNHGSKIQITQYSDTSYGRLRLGSTSRLSGLIQITAHCDQ
jgi:hypothetical protein